MYRPALSAHSKTRSKDAAQISVRKENERLVTRELKLEAPMVGLDHKILFDFLAETAGTEPVLEFTQPTLRTLYRPGSLDHQPLRRRRIDRGNQVPEAG